MNWNDVDSLMPKLSQLDLAIAINACREAGARNAADALSKHISRLEMELEIANKKLLSPDLSFANRLLWRLVDENHCRIDHNGFCQEHFCHTPCPHGDACAFLKKHGK